MLAQFCHLIYVAVDCFRTKPRFPMDLPGFELRRRLFPPIPLGHRMHRTSRGPPGAATENKLICPVRPATTHRSPVDSELLLRAELACLWYRYTWVVYYKTVRAVASRRTLIALIDWLNLWLINACSLAKHLTPFFPSVGAVVGGKSGVGREDLDSLIIMDACSDGWSTLMATLRNVTGRTTRELTINPHSRLCVSVRPMVNDGFLFLEF